MILSARKAASSRDTVEDVTVLQDITCADPESFVKGGPTQSKKGGKDQESIQSSTTPDSENIFSW